MEEILAIMEEMGLLKNLKTDRITFCSEMFVKYDANDDGVLRRALRHHAAAHPRRHRRHHPLPHRHRRHRHHTPHCLPSATNATHARTAAATHHPRPHRRHHHAASTSSKGSTTRPSTTREGASVHPSLRPSDPRRLPAQQLV